MSDFPGLGDYSPAELEAADAWPAIRLYRQMLARPVAGAGDTLRVKRQEFWLRAAIATFHDRVPARDVCEFWSNAADTLIKEAWVSSGLAATGSALMALGKLGSMELNLSSDVDLIICRPDSIQPDLRTLRDFQSMLAENTAFGFCLRVDLTLRPGGRSSAAIPSASEFMHHYGYHGEMWERLAFVRARYLFRELGSNTELVEEISTFTRKFSYRKHLDYTVLEDLKALRARIRTEKFETRPNSYHLKLGIGGIRELELFIHAMQVMHGGRNPGLQTFSTSAAIDELKKLALLPEAECDFLKEAYWYLRTLENRLQAFEDQQSYYVDLQKGHPALPLGFQAQLVPITERVSSIVTSLLGEVENAEGLSDGLEAQQEWLAMRKFSRESREETWPALMSATALSRRSEVDERARIAFLSGFVSKLAEIGLDRDLGLSLLLDFVKAVRAKASFFTLLNRETRVRDELATLFSISPYLGTILVSRPELIDEFIFRKQAPASEDLGVLLEELAERRLLSELISANRFLADRDLRTMTLNLASNADEITTLLLARLKREHGASDTSLVALGKWGGRELGLRSDLDFIFVSKDASSPEAQKVARRFLSRITEPHRGGSIYSVDMRLRPTGSAGPIMVSEDELAKYLREKAAAWERQAYLRARPLAGIGISIGAIAAERGLSQEDLAELKRIRSGLFTAAAAQRDSIDLKLTVGGLADVEFTAQIALLVRREFSLDPSTSGMIQYLEGICSKWANVGPSIRERYEAMRGIEQLFQLTTSQSGSKLRTKSDEFRRLALVLDSTAGDLEIRLRQDFTDLEKLLFEVRDIPF